MTLAHIDPQIVTKALSMARSGIPLPDIADATGMLTNEIRQVIDQDRQRRATQAPPAPAKVASPPAFRPPSALPPVGKVPAAGGSYITVLRAGDLFIDDTYQRPLDQNRVDKMGAAFDVTLVGVIEVSARPDGRYAVVDGQHRWAMLMQLDPRKGETPICCHVHLGLTVEQEAALFRDIDRGRRALTTWDRWHARLAAGEPTVAAIDRTVRHHGLLLSDQVRAGRIRATKTLEDIEAIGGVALVSETIGTLKTAWGDGADTYAAELLMGTALVRAGYQSVDLGRLVDVLMDTTPRQVGARARALRETQSGSLGWLTGLYMTSLYNRTLGPKLGPLPSYGYFSSLKKRRTAKAAAHG